ncbi:MAG: glutamine-hydrolyzing GMP synthase [Chloroflexota bacterium]|nr:glutamine-hydrolyzing GMP synthase [Chloroflexota bacterium]
MGCHASRGHALPRRPDQRRAGGQGSRRQPRGFPPVPDRQPGQNLILAADSPAENVIVLDFGSQTSRLIARRIRECNVYSELLPHDTPWEEIQRRKPCGIVLSGSPSSVYEAAAPRCDKRVFGGSTPVLGICYGLQLMTDELGGRVKPFQKREFGPAQLIVDGPSPLFKGLPPELPVWMSHGDAVAEPPPGFHALAHTDNSPVAAIAATGMVAIQFHPEVVHTPHGTDIIRNFLYEYCGCKGTWTPGSMAQEAIERVRRQVGDGRILCALSGGVDSSVAAAIIHQAVGDRLVCVFVDNGLLRKNEAAEVVDTFGRHMKLNLVHVDAGEHFLRRLEGIEEPEEKRKIIGDEFIRVFMREADSARVGPVDFLAQGTLYPDVIESTSHDTTAAHKIKTHHNVGGLPKDMPWTGAQLIEPLRYMFKDEVREVGLTLGLPEEVVWRQPFPGPGLAIRVIGAVTRERLDTLREADAIVLEEIRAAGLYQELWQSFAVLTPLKSVGVMGDARTYANVVAIRAVNSSDAMTADWARLPYDLLARMSNRIVNEVAGVNRVVYDVSSKPPATIEWE